MGAAGRNAWATANVGLVVVAAVHYKEISIYVLISRHYDAILGAGSLSRSTDGWRHDGVMNSSANESWVGNITADEVREVWDGQIRTVPADLVSPDVSSATRQFLTEVGLPTTEVDNIIFAFDSRLSSTVRQEGREYLVVTDDESNVTFAIDVESEQVFRFHPSRSKYTRFFNSNIATLVFFLGLLKKNVLSLDEVDQEILADAVDSVRIPLSARDPAAMEGETNCKDWLDDLETQYE